jgi:hypothetical protein
VVGLLLAAAGYLVASVVVWWPVWSNHPTTTSPGVGFDSSLTTWFFEWAAYAVEHGLNPFYTATLFHPVGTNLVQSPWDLGLPLAPVTWIFGPVASLNVALTLSPVLSALAMFVLLRRWVSWSPAAFAGGLFYGFSPFVLVELSNSHLNLGMVAVPPLIVLCLDDLFVRQRRRPLVSGIALGLLVVLQFFIATEVLVDTVIVGVISLILIGAYAVWRHPEAVRQRAHHAVVGLAAGGVTAVVLLAYPTWFALDGPAHLSGQLFPGLSLQDGGITLGRLAFPASASSVQASLGIYSIIQQHFLLSSQYLGLGAIAVAIIGSLVWYRDRRLWVFATVAVVSIVLALGVQAGTPLPWQLLYHLPLLNNAIPNRIVLLTYLVVAVMVGLVIDHTYVEVRRRVARSGAGSPVGATPAAGDHRHGPARRSRSAPWVGALAGVAVAAVALVPPAIYVAPDLPIGAGPVILPTWFRTVAPHLKSGQVVLALPVPFSTAEAGMTWQATDGLHYSIVGGSGAGAVPSRAGIERNGQAVLVTASFSFFNEVFHAGDVGGVRQAIAGWGVDLVVVPDQPGLPLYDQIPSVTYAAALFTAATGQLPVHQAGAWVWAIPTTMKPASTLTAAQLNACTSGLAPRGTEAVQRATQCVLAHHSAVP